MSQGNAGPIVRLQLVGGTASGLKTPAPTPDVIMTNAVWGFSPQVTVKSLPRPRPRKLPQTVYTPAQPLSIVTTPQGGIAVSANPPGPQGAAQATPVAAQPAVPPQPTLATAPVQPQVAPVQSVTPQAQGGGGGTGGQPPGGVQSNSANESHGKSFMQRCSDLPLYVMIPLIIFLMIGSLVTLWVIASFGMIWMDKYRLQEMGPLTDLRIEQAKKMSDAMKSLPTSSLQSEVKQAEAFRCRTFKEKEENFAKHINDMEVVGGSNPPLSVSNGCVWVKAIGTLASVDGNAYQIEYLSGIPGETWKSGPLGDMQEPAVSVINRKQGQFRVIVKEGGHVIFRSK
jgi:hypothetical protein